MSAPALSISPPASTAAPYDHTFFDRIAARSLQSARIVVPLVTELLRPCSVVDIGCGTGCWLKAFLELGVTDVLGFDGEYVDRERLSIPRAQFIPTDLAQKKDIEARADLAVCLEVAEHLPLGRSESLVRSLTQIAPAVLFSAAVPGQGGTHHINEQWPIFWRELFRRRGFHRLDPLRTRILHDQCVEWWYRQNIFLYVSESLVKSNELLRREFEAVQECDFEIVSTALFSKYTSPIGLGQAFLRELWGALRRRLSVRGS